MRSDEIDEAKKKLPLPVLMHRLGGGEHAKKSARCPFHEDKHNSFSVWQRPDAGCFGNVTVAAVRVMKLTSCCSAMLGIFLTGRPDSIG
jgi:hypothetical protein